MFRKTKTGILNNDEMTRLHSSFGNVAALEIIGDTMNAIYKDDQGEVIKVNHNLN